MIEKEGILGERERESVRVRKGKRKRERKKGGERDRRDNE